MSVQSPIATAPRNGQKVTVFWTDRDGQENESIAQYRALDRLKTAGGDWDDSDAGWWTSIDGDTQKRIEPHSWTSGVGDDDDS